MTRNNVIKPDVLNILCSNFRERQRTAFEPPPIPEPEPESTKTFLGKVKGFFAKAKRHVKEIVAVAVSVVLCAASLLNAMARFRESHPNHPRHKDRRSSGGRKRAFA